MTERILLLEPLPNRFTQYDSEMYPSQALILIGTMLGNEGYEVKIVHMLADGVDPLKLKDIVSTFKPRFVGITMNTFQTLYSRIASRVIKKVDGNILVVVGGPHPSALKSSMFDEFPYVDVVVVGEGEYTFLEIVKGKDLETINGICYRAGENIKTTPPRPLAENLDHIPLPNLDLIDIKRFRGCHPVGARPSMCLMASRGCPYHCIFCNKSVWGTTVRFRKPEMVIEEVRWLHEKYGIKEIYFHDDTFNLNRRWVEEVLNSIIEGGLNKGVIYKAPFRANKKLVDEELLRLAKRAGFWMIFYGVESGSQEMLDRMKKGETVEEIKRAFSLTHKVGLKTNASFIEGLPGETRRTIMDSIGLYKEIKPYIAGYTYAFPLPGTELESTVREKKHYLVSSYDEYASGKLITRTDSLSAHELKHYQHLFADLIGEYQLKDAIAHPLLRINNKIKVNPYWIDPLVDSVTSRALTRYIHFFLASTFLGIKNICLRKRSNIIDNTEA